MLRAYMQDDITVLYDNGQDIYNEPLATTDVEMKAYIIWESHLINKISGGQVVGSPMISRAKVYVMPTRVVTHKDKIKIDTTEYTILDVGRGKDFSQNHQEVHIL